MWGQVTTPRMAAAPWMQTLLRWTGREHEQIVPSVASTLESMDAADVDITFLSAWYGPEGPLITNEEVAAQIAEAPARFRGLASVDLRKPVEAVRQIRKWTQDEAFVGVRVVPWLWDEPPNHRLYYPLYVACVEAGVPLCTQIGHTGPLRRSEPGRLIPYLEDVLLDFPDLVVVGGHVGFPWIDELTSLTFKYPNLYVDTSAYTLARLPDAFITYLRGAGAGRVMFGTNWPMIPHARCLRDIDRLGLSDEEATQFLGDTARRVFRL